MGKEGELWDDSALVKAFDDAMSKYKKMHGKNKTNVEEKVTSSGEAIGSAHENQNHEPRREAEDANALVLETKTEMGETENIMSVKEDPCVESYAPELHVESSNGLATNDAVKGHSHSQGSDDYNQLLSQYYELEEKKQQILQQLHQFSAWNYQFSGEGAQWGTYTTSQEHPVPASQESQTVVCSCCPYGCQFLVAPCTAYPSCSLGGACTSKTCTDKNAAAASRKSTSLVNDDIVNTAMGAAGKAISSMKSKSFVYPDINEEIEEKKENESISSETDLTVVLNAWYSAGFYTGKYLTEQSMAKNRRSKALQHDACGK
ncbi:hypothetical protein CISIN_1g019321mg [Citrus sinensis]|uniref:Survival Motor Neuron Gemin2-binding domain-containing protein n=3 Tax=Citrus TaxID=2706 RepID=A0A067E8X5_CITSI|nr:hypothetical protein CISIN_1g019321mg [Citrus sinensis]